MALSGTINGSVTQKSNYFSFYLTWSATQNVAGNYSDVTVSTYWSTNNTYQTFDTVASRNASITINGATSSISKVFSVYWSSNPYLIQTYTQRVYHNSDGAKSISISARANGHAAGWGPSSTEASSGDCTVSGTITLNTIPRASSISSVGNVALGNKCSVTFTPASTSFQYNITFSLGSWSVSTGRFTPGTTSAYTYNNYTIPSNNSTLLGQIPSSTTGTMRATLTTYNSSGTQIGSTSYKDFTVTIPSDIKPTVGTITLTPVKINDQAILVQNKNTLQISVSGCSAGTGSTIKSYAFSGPGISKTVNSTSTSASATSNTVSNTGTLTYTVTVTDNRGRTASSTKTCTCYAYSKPTITLNAYRVNSSGTSDSNGTSVKCEYTLNYSSVNSTNNAKSVKIYYQQNGNDSKTTITVANNSTSKSGTKTLSDIAADKIYTVYASIADQYGSTINSSKVTIFGADRILNIRPQGKGIAFGKMASSNNVLDSRWPISSDDPAGTMDNLTFRGSNAISSTANDTTSNWVSQGNLATTYYNTADQLNGQPGTYGFVVNVTNGAQQVHQLWMSQELAKDGKDIRYMYHRGGNANGFGDWRTILDSSNYTDLVAAKPVMFYSNISSPSSGTITKTLADGDHLDQYTYLEIFYVDNNGNGHNSVRVYKPNGTQVDLSIIEVSDSTATNNYIRRTTYTIAFDETKNKVTITPKATTAGYIQISDTNVSQSTGTNYIKIRRVLGYK